MNDPAAPTPYDRIGGEAGLRRMTQRMYALMDTLPEAAAVRAQHPATLDGSEQKLFEFLSGWLGGPSLYIERFGHPRLRARHLPFAIGIKERDQWVACMSQAMVDVQVPDALVQRLQQAFMQTADWMRNK